MAVTAREESWRPCASPESYDNDGRLDLYISDFQRSSDHLWHNEGKGLFDEVSEQTGIHDRPVMCSVSVEASSIMTTMAGWIFLSLTAMSTPRSNNHARHPLQANELIVPQRRNGRFTEVSRSSGNGLPLPM
jgi:hypothetical protein